MTPEVALRLEDGRGAPDEFVWAGKSGAPLSSGNFRNRVWRAAVIEAELAEPRPTPHALRRTAVAHWIWR